MHVLWPRWNVRVFTCYFDPRCGICKCVLRPLSGTSKQSGNSTSFKFIFIAFTLLNSSALTNLQIPSHAENFLRGPCPELQMRKHFASATAIFFLTIQCNCSAVDESLDVGLQKTSLFRTNRRSIDPRGGIHQIVSRFIERFRYMCPLLFSCVFPS
jgi:hypothetical protein